MGKLYGLYIKLSRDGKIKRTLSAVKGKGKLKDTTIAEELMSFMRLDLNEFSEVVNSLDAISESVEIQTEDGYEEVDMDKFTELLQKVNDYIQVYEKKDILHGTLFRTMMEDAVPVDDGSAWFVYESKHRMITKMDDILRVQYYMGLALQRLCEKKPLNMKKDFPMLQGVECIQILDMGEKLSEQYYFRSICNYYAYLFLRFLNKKPLVARCYCCGNYFIPKTRKMTLYCDRIFKNGKTCKQIGPTLKHKLNIEKDEVLKTFDKVKQKMYKRYERQNDAMGDLPHGLSWQEYQAWHTKATQARDAYVAGKVSAEETIKIINDTDIN